MNGDQSERCLPQLVAAWSASTPNVPAVTSNGVAMSYGDLEWRASRLAGHLSRLGAGPDVPVGLCLERSAGMVVGALGILKAGAAYIALDPAQPADRLEYMLNDSRALLVVASPRAAFRLSSAGRQVVVLDTNASQAADMSEPPPSCRITPGNLAYIIYTSGSTGQPKGVEITHGSLLNLVAWHQQAFQVTSADRATQQASPGFDAAVWELWPYLTAGASIHVPDDYTRVGPDLLRDWLVRERITVSFVSTPLAERLMGLDWPAETRLRALLTGGDTLHRYPPARLPFLVVNNYGPTEATVVATSGVVPSDAGTGAPTIGRPIANVQIYIVDQHLRQTPAGVGGELCIGGAGLARGYVNRPEATAEKFVTNPFSDEPGSRLYKTGDRACYLPDGQIAFLGRLDDQIKIRGYRIEPAEIVGALNAHPAVQAGAVVARADQGDDPRLVGYIVLEPGVELTPGALAEFLRERLPEYMVPVVFVRMDVLPLTASGKIDRAALPPPTASNTLRDRHCRRPVSAVEERVATIVSALMGLPDIDVDDNFFLLGGHSLLAAQVITRLHDTFEIDLSLRSLFESPTLAGLSAEVERLIMAKVDALSEAEVERMLADAEPRTI
jgi:amino acid adenylation domain-containing protein